MTANFKEIGDFFEEQNSENLTIPAAQKAYLAVLNSSFCELVELRRLVIENELSEIIVIDCLSDGVPSRNKIGIKYRERLALRFFDNETNLPEVRALRYEFPDTYHQNHVVYGEPAALCIYLEPWSSVRRSWTPQKHLKAILVWLEKTASGTLHTENQPLEPFFFENSKFRIILPVDFDEKAGSNEWTLIAEPRITTTTVNSTLAGVFVPSAQVPTKNNIPLHTITIKTPSVVHGEIERTPGRLGELHDQFFARGVDLACLIHENLKSRSERVGLSKLKEDFTLLVLSIPLVRKSGGEIEKIQQKGFCLHASLTSLGECGGVLREDNGKYWYTQLVGQEGFVSDKWRSILIGPLELLEPFTRATARRASGITPEGPKGVLAGVGSLGSSLHNIWIRQGWGEWQLIDPDLINPHNLARHTAFESQIGANKADAVKALEKSIYPHEEERAEPIAENASQFSNETVATTMSEAALVVDATTTLNVPRELSVRDNIGRTISTFITPSGLGAVLIAEDSERYTRLDTLEAQYYKAIINSDWGEYHLSGHSGNIWVGAGCRDMSTIISTDLIQLHSATLARHIRIRSDAPEASTNIWTCDPVSGEVSAVAFPASRAESVNLGDYTLVWDEVIKNKVSNLRKKQLPNETGGILLGYYDQVLSRVYIVDAYPAPTDSQEEATGFIRGTEGLIEIVNTARNRTANIVGYVGEWHSHPPRASANPSCDDILLLTHLAQELNDDGFPALMLIVGEYSENWLVAELRD